MRTVYDSKVGRDNSSAVAYGGDRNSCGVIKGFSELRQLIHLGTDAHRKNNENETSCEILQKTIAAQEQLIHTIIKNEPLEETGLSVVHLFPN